MLKLGCGAVALLSLIAAAVLLWTTSGVPEGLPSGLGGWMEAWFDAFREPASSILLFAVCALLAFAAASVTELLLGIFLSAIAALAAVLCLLGALGARYPGVAEYVEKMLG